MKTLIALALISASTFASNAFATLDCRDVQAGPDHGYMLQFSPDHKSVTVSEETIAGPMKVADLACEISRAPAPSGNDMQRTILTCRQPGIADAGFSLTVEQGGFAGLTTAHLYQESIRGADQVAEFGCR